MLTVPVASADFFELPQDTSLTIHSADILANDTDAENDALQAALVLGDGPNYGKLTVGVGGNLVYTPDRGFYGEDRFGYFASDGQSFSAASARVTIKVKQVIPPASSGGSSAGTIILHPAFPGVVEVISPGSRDPSAPIAQSDNYTTAEDIRLTIDVTAGVLVNDTSGDSSPLAATLETAPQHGTVTLNADGSFSYLSSQDYFGPDKFVYRLTNGTAFSDLGTVSLGITPVNDPPVVNDDRFQTESGLPLTISIFGLLSNDRDVDSNWLTLALPLASAPKHGSLSLRDYRAIYTPDLGYQGNDGFAYVATDGQDFSVSSANVSIEMTAPVRHNARLATDVNNDARLSPVDVLLVINWLNGMGTGPVARTANYGRELLDVNGDGLVAPVDALLVINALNSHASGSEGESAEGESVVIPEASQFGLTAETESLDLLSTLALDSAAAARRRRL